MGKTFKYYGIGTNYVTIDSSNNQKLYGIKLAGTCNRLIKLNNLKEFAKNYRNIKNSKVFIFISKDYSIGNIYLYSYNFNLINDITKRMGLDLLTGDELVESLHQMFFIANNYIENNRILNSIANSEFDFKKEVLSSTFQRKIHNANTSFLKEGSVFQGVSPSSTDFDILSLMKIDFRGVLSISIDFSISRTTHLIETVKRRANMGDKKTYVAANNLKSDKDEISNLYSNYGLVNISLVLKDTELLPKIASSTGINFIKNDLNAEESISKTLLLVRNVDFTFPLKYEKIEYFFTSNIKLPENFPQVKKFNRPDMIVKDLTSCLTNYTLCENASPHIGMFGKTGAGKSASFLKMLKMILGIEDEDSFSKELDEDRIFIRYSDVGYTGARLAKDLKNAMPKKVQIYRADLNVRFSLFNFKIDDYSGSYNENDIDFTVSFINLILAVPSAVGESNSNQEKLTDNEKKNLKKAIKTILYEGASRDYSLSQVETIGGYNDALIKLYELGYDKTSKISQIKEKEFDFLKKPTIDCLIDEISKKSKSPDLSSLEKNIYDSLRVKLDSITSYPIFRYFDVSNEVDVKNFTYIDYEPIKENRKMFVAIYWLLFKKWSDYDIRRNNMLSLKGDTVPYPHYYICEEADNFTKIPEFVELYNVVTREARKKGIFLVFITQLVTDIPDNIFANLGNKFIIFKEGDREEVRAAIKNKIDEFSKNREYVFDKIVQSDTEKYFYVLNDNGAVALSVELTKYEKDIQFKKLDLTLYEKEMNEKGTTIFAVD